ncbi:SulP family inorganic anion transporter [Pelomonas cellulosilytica]|uniref:Cyclic nucleotide-binding domain-containing protein n=1 Tax=Pelomonas cellulosilytica TaxID=2906762 RepID=A0ABS8XV14_9BURK|nr:SulP family inorganic anion transporter [Pelomonas sp. P8]MCE4554656.1 cyclic nucleotide-binding domain-containing protein [Pelomonas sp. P8]
MLDQRMCNKPAIPHKTSGDKPAPLWIGLWRDCIAALVVGLSAISSYLSAATLIFQGPLAVHLPAAIGAALLGGAVLSLIGAWRGALPLASAGPVPTTVPLMAAMAAGVASRASAQSLLPTAVTTISIAGLGVGTAWWVMGRRGWGDLTRYIPYPVVGGFLAATGWMMLTGGLSVAMGQAFTWAQVVGALSGAADARLAVGVVLGVLIWQVTLHSRHPLTLPILLVLGIVGIQGGLAAAGWDANIARATGWMLAPFSHALPVSPLSSDLWRQVDWGLVAQQSGLIASTIAVATLSLLLTDTSLEAAWDIRVDINRDLRALGQGNLLAAAAGGLMGGQSISRSLLNRAAGAHSRCSGAMLGLLCLLAMAWGGPALALVPRPLLGALLVYQGLGVMKTWLVDSRRRIEGIDYLTIVAMVLITALVGFVPAVSVGVLACCVAFAVSSSRLSPVRRFIKRSAWPAKVERNASQTELLQREGAGMTIVELQGVLFFGSTTRLSTHIESLFEIEDRPRLLLLDFRHVRGIDISAAQALARLLAAASRQGMSPALSGLSLALRRPLAAGGVLRAAGPLVHASIDDAVAAWDLDVLSRHGCLAATLEAALSPLLPHGTPIARLLSHFEPRRLDGGEQLFARGDRSDALYLLRSGRIVIYSVGEDGTEILLRTMHEGSVIGEMGLLRQIPRSAAARADGPVELLLLSRERLDRLTREAPELAAALFRLLVMQMADRVEQLSLQANALAR